MSKYIKIKDIRNALAELNESGKWLERDTTISIIKALADLPIIDIVHCKDCTFAKPTNTENVIQCTWLSGYRFRKDHYCSAGERKDNE